MAQLCFWQILIEHRKIVAEVKEGLHRITFWQCAASNVEHPTLRHTIYLSTQVAKAPTEINFLIVSKEASVETIHTPIVGTAYHQTSTCCPHHLAHIIVLPLIFLYSFKESATTERITIAINVTSTGSCILEKCSVVLGKQLRLTGCSFRMPVHKVDECVKPTFRHLYITIEQYIIFILHLPQCTIVTFRKTIIAIKNNSTHCRKLLLKKRKRSIGRSIICYNNVSNSLRVLQHRWQETT